MQTDRVSRISSLGQIAAMPFDWRRLRALRPLASLLYCLFLSHPLVAFSQKSSQTVAVRADGQYGNSATKLQNITSGSNPVPVAVASGPGSAQSQAIQPAYSEGGSSVFVVNFDESTAVVDFSWWDLTTCQSSAMIPYLYTPPAYGSVTYTIGSGTVTSSPCTGTVVPVTQIYYTWNTHTSASLNDFFEVHANDPEGDQFDWIAQPELLAKSNGDCCKGPGGAGAGDPISIGTGNVFERVVDYETAGQNKLSYIRSYNSLPVPSTFASTLGLEWRSNYDRYLYFYSSDFVVAERPDGQLINFYSSNGSWSSDTDTDYTLTESGTTWTLTDSDDTVETYTALKGTSAGLLQSIALRNGYTQDLTYDHNNFLKSVADSYRRSLAFTYSNGRVATVTTPDGLVLTYGYNSVNSTYDRLASVSYSTSPVTSQQYLYDPNRPYALTSIVDENGNVYQSWTYDDFYRGLSNQVGGRANLVTVSYNGDGTRTVTNALGVADTYTFSILQDMPKLSQISRAATSTTAAASETFTYDSNGYLSGETDWDGNQTTYVNDSHGDPTTITQAVGSPVERTTSISYDAVFPHLPDTITAPGLTTSFTYDGSGNVLTKTLTDTTTQSVPYSTNGATKTWQYTWQNSLLASVQSPRTDVVERTTYSYNSGGALTAITNPLNQTTSITSSTGGGLPQTIVDPNSLTTNLVYDARQRLTSSTAVLSSKSKKNPVTRVTTYGYDAAGNVTSVTQPDGSGLTYTYDAAHRLTGMKDLFGQSISYSLDALGHPLSTGISNSSNILTGQHSNTYDALGRMLQDIGASNQTSSFTYDSVGNMLTASDQLSNTTQRVFDALNRLTRITDPASGVTTATYDAHDRALSVTAPTGGATAYVYDGFGDLIQKNSPNTGTTVYYYNSAGNLLKRVAATGAVTQYTYDALDRMLTMTFPTDSAENVAYTYDQSGHGYGIGQLTSVSDAAGALSRTYDQLGNLLTSARTTSAGTLSTTYTYDAANRIASITYPSGALVSYARDIMGRITAVTATPNGATNTPVVSSVAYEPFGPATTLTYGNGIAEARGFDQDYRLTGITDTGTSVVQNLAYVYYPTNNVQTITDAVNSSNSQSFSYDVLQRLSGATGGNGSFGYTYDKNGNRLSQTHGIETTNYGYGASSDLLTTLSVGGVQTQAIGSTTDGRIATLNPGIQAPGGQSITSLSYNQEAQLAAVNATGGFLATYTYDGFGERLIKTISGTNGEIYQYDQDRMLLEETNSSGIAQADYIYFHDRLVAVLNGSTLYYLHDDRLNTPQLATDSAQNIQWQASYDSYGQASVSGTISQNLRFPGQYFDVESGWNHNGFRDYLPTLGRYAEPDPLGRQGSGNNLYVYVNDNPVNLIDPLGLCFLDYLKSCEGTAPGGGYGAYNDTKNNCTTGYGHLVHLGPCSTQEIAQYSSETQAQAYAQLQTDYNAAVQWVNRNVSGLDIGQQNALIDLYFNMGPDRLQKHDVWKDVTSGNLNAVPADIMTLLAGGPGIATRRANEASMWKGGPIPKKCY